MGVFVICGALLAVALLVFLCESLVLLGKKCNGDTTTEADDNDTARDVLRLLTTTEDACSSYYRRRMNILDVAWTGMTAETPSTSNTVAVVHSDTMPKVQNTVICDTPQASIEISSAPHKTAIDTCNPSVS